MRIVRSREFIDRQYRRYLRHHLLQKYKKIVLYLIFGSSAALVDLLAFLFLFNIVNIPAVVSTIISISLATIVGFVLNALINFRVNDRFLLRFLSYSLVSTVGMSISSFMLYVFHEMHGFNGNLIKIISLPIIFLVQYLLNSRISFRKRQTGENNINEN